MKASIFQEYIYIKWLKGKCDVGSNILRREDVVNYFIRAHIPKSLHRKFLKELEDIGMIKQINKQKIQICSCVCNHFEEDETDSWF